MENHPIPQDITGFQFKLIGDMTIKQFAYLATGAILGWIIYILPIFILIKIPLVLFFAGFGVAAAFVPIEGRPLDIMVINYFRALFSSTQYVYQKVGGRMWFPQDNKQSVGVLETKPVSSDAARRLKDFLKSLPKKPANKLDEKELGFLSSLSSLSSVEQTNQDQESTPIKSGSTAFEQLEKTAPKIGDKEEGQEDNLKTETEVLKKQLEEARLAQTFQMIDSPQYEVAHSKVLELEKLLQEVQSQKQILENQIIELRKKLERQNQNVFTPSIAQPKVQTQTVRKVPRELGKSLGLPLTADVPNLIAGIIKDPRDNPIPNILVEVKDEAGNPVRAFKTNVLGQFISATPLANGVYTISFEDPKAENKFDTIELKVTGGILMPVEVISLDTREELRRSLFNPPAGGQKK